jgi:hypothetical protein
LEMDMLLFFLDRLDRTQVWRNGKIGCFDHNAWPQPWRGMTDLPILRDAGWHCEYFGRREELLAKLNAVSHAPEPGCQNMRRLVEAGELPGMERTEFYPPAKRPRAVIADREKYESYFHE